MSALDTRGLGRIQPWLAIALLALPPALIAVIQLGVLHPDEVYQALEPASQLAFGRGLLVWEWQSGLRNWAVPSLFAGLLRLAAALRIDDPQARRVLLELPQYALHAVALFEVYRLVERRVGAAASSGAAASGHGVGPGIWGVALVALYAPVLHFAGRTMSESYSTSLLVIGLARIDMPSRTARNYALGGLCLGLAVIARYGSAVVAVAAVLWLCGARRWRDAAQVSAGGALAALVLGAIDWHAWGRPFYSLLNYFQFNVASGQAAKTFGSEPIWFYLKWLAIALPLWSWPASFYAVRAARLRDSRSEAVGASGLLVCCSAVYTLAISCVEHKEPRFLYPALVLWLVALMPAWIAGPHVRGVPDSLRLGLSVLLGLGLLFFETPFGPRQTNEFRMFVKAARAGRGVVLVHPGPYTWETPGQFYAGDKPSQLCRSQRGACLRSALADARFDRVVTRVQLGDRELRAHGFALTEQCAEIALWTRIAQP